MRQRPRQVWKYAEATGNEKWKGLAWGMVPSHASGVAACTYHFFFNAKAVVPLVTLQVGVLTLRIITISCTYPLADGRHSLLLSPRVP